MQGRYLEDYQKTAAAAYTYIVVDKNVEFIFGIIQSQQPVEEFRKKWSWLLNEYSNQHSWILLFR